MVIIEHYPKTFTNSEVIPPVCLSNKNTYSVYYEYFYQTIKRQKLIAKLFNIGDSMTDIKEINEKELSVSDLNKIIDIINVNFKTLNDFIVKNNTQINKQKYSENTVIKAYFFDLNKTMDVIIQDNKISIAGGKSKIIYSVATEEVDYGN